MRMEWCSENWLWKVWKPSTSGVVWKGIWDSEAVARPAARRRGRNFITQEMEL
jgi:hypothetical protein